MQKGIEKIKHLRDLLTICYRNLHRLEWQIAMHGGEVDASLKLLNQRDETQDRIESLEQELQQLTAQKTVETVLPTVRVFISTGPDLLPQRAEVAKAINNITLSTARIEVISPQTATVTEAELTVAQNCDLFIGLYGKQYGSPISGDGRTVAEIEYQAAYDNDKPRLIYTTSTVSSDETQQEFLGLVADPRVNQTNQILRQSDSVDELLSQIQADAQAQIEGHGEWSARPAANGRVLLASLGLAPGAVVGLYHALTAEAKQPHRVVTFSTAPYRNMRQAIDICRDEFERLEVPYTAHHINAPEIEYDEDAQEFKALFQGLLQEYLQGGAEVMTGITGGRTVMGALMTLVVQTLPVSDRLSMYHLYVAEEIEKDGRLPGLLRFRNDDEMWRKLVSPPPEMRRLVRVPFVQVAR